jgi:hypothetical protein
MQKFSPVQPNGASSIKHNDNKQCFVYEVSFLFFCYMVFSITLCSNIAECLQNSYQMVHVQSDSPGVIENSTFENNINFTSIITSDKSQSIAPLSTFTVHTLNNNIFTLNTCAGPTCSMYLNCRWHALANFFFFLFSGH